MREAAETGGSGAQRHHHPETAERLGSACSRARLGSEIQVLV